MGTVSGTEAGREITPTALIVVGHHRGGTSATAAAMRAMGVYFGEEAELMPPSPDNPRGYHEHLGIVTANDALLYGLGLDWSSYAPMPSDWISGLPFRHACTRIETVLRDLTRVHPVVGIKDPRLTRLCPLYQAAAHRVGVRLRAVVVERNIEAVIRSLVVRGIKDGQPWDDQQAWRVASVSAEGMREWSERVPSERVTFPDFIGTGGREVIDAVARLSSPLAPQFNPRAVAAALDTDLVHHG